MHNRPQGIAAVTRTLGLGLLLCGAAACGGGSAKAPAEDGFNRLAMLAHWGQMVIVPAYRGFADAARALDAAAAAYAATPTEGTRQAAQQAWRQAMASWQPTESFQLGPAGMPSTFRGGRALADRIYAWPSVSPCRIDQHIAAQDYTAAGFAAGAAVTATGLAALEYLLFNTDPGNRCSATSPINQNGSWAALGNAEVARRRAAMAQVVAAELGLAADRLRQAWEAGEGGFVTQLSTAGQGSEVYDSAQTALDEMFAALFSLDLRVKDAKLAVPAGIDPACTQSICPDSLESPWAEVAKENIAANLLGFQRIFLGDDLSPSTAPGFDDWLRQRGAGDLADRMTAEIAAARQAVDAIPGSLRQALTQNLEAVRAAHTAVRALTDSMKGELVTVLNLRVPQQGAGDND